MTKKPIILLWAIVLVLLAAFFGFYIKTTLQTISKEYDVSSGVFNFSDIDFNKESLIEIRGDVEFYKDTFLTHDDFIGKFPPTPTTFLKIPGKWNQLRDSSDAPSGHGYGTYHFKIVVPEKRHYGFKIKDFKLAYSISTNGSNKGGTGTIGTTKNEMIPSRYQNEFYFLPESDTVDVLICVSNFHHRKGGATGNILFGFSEDINLWKANQIGIESFLIGLLFILFIYHLTLYAYRNKDKSMIYFSLLCFSMFMRTGYIGERLFLDVFDFVGWNMSTKLEYISFMGIPIFTTLFLNNLFPKEVRNYIVYIVNSVATICVIMIVFCSPTTYSYTSLIIQYVLGPASLFIVVMLGVAVFRKRDYALQVFIGFFIFFILSIHDAIMYATIIDSIYLMPAGLFVVTFSQAYVLAQKLSSTYSKSEEQANELKEYANNLEKLVHERTMEIQLQKVEIEKQKKDIESTVEELRVSNENLVRLAEYKKNMTNMLVHDLKNPLNNIIGFTSIKTGIDKFKDYINASGWKMYTLIQNILDVEKYESLEIEINKKLIDLYEVVVEALESTRFMMQNNRLNFYNEITDNIIISADIDLVFRVLSNILSNAAKYANSDGFVKITSENYITDKGKKHIKICIYNDGDAIPENNLETIFEKYNRMKNSIDNQYHSSGIGLAFCKLAVNAHGGEIGAISGEKYGVTFWFTLPIE